MKIIVDGIIEKLQDNGGCTVYFSQLLNFLQNTQGVEIDFLKYASIDRGIKLQTGNSHIYGTVSRLMERWRDVKVDESLLSAKSIFHSTHYRLPTKKHGLKTVTTVHDFTYELYRSGPPQWMHSWQKFRAIRNSDLVICVSQNTAADLMKYCPIDKEKIRVVYNGVSDVYRPLDLRSISNEVVFIGARGWYKNFTLAVETLSNLPDLTLAIVGGGALSKDECELLETKLPGRFKWYGRLDDSSLNELYNRAHCLFYPSSYEGFGIPVAESMRAGCPVIAVAVSSIPEVAGDAAILVDSASVENFVSAFHKLQDPALRASIIEKGFKQSSKFSWYECYKATLAVYEELI